MKQQAGVFYGYFANYSFGKRLTERIKPPQIITSAMLIIIIAELLMIIPPL